MLKLLDRYVVVQYFSKLITSMLAFMVIFIIVDVVDHLDKFIDSNMPQDAIFRYYQLTLPWFISISLPMSLLLATVFCMGLLQRRHEITAIKASGISIRRISIPLLIFGIVFSILSFYGDNLIVAPFLNQRADLEQQYFNSSKRNKKIRKQDIFRQIGENEILAIKRYSFKNHTALNVSIQKYSQGSLISRLDSPAMTWDSEAEHWRLDQYRIRIWDENGNPEFINSTSDTLLELDFTPVDLTTESVKPEEMNFWQLERFVQRLKDNGIKDPSWEVNLHFKTAFACSSFLMILFGLSLSIGKPRSNMAVGLGMSIFIIFLYYAILKFGQSLGYEGVLSPFISVWLGNIIFFVLGIYLFFKTRT